MQDTAMVLLGTKACQEIGIKSAADLRNLEVKEITNNPALANQLMREAAKLSILKPAAMMQGGREYNINVGKNRTSTSKEGSEKGKYRTEYVSEEGGNEIDYLNYGYYDEKGEFVRLKREEIERGEGNGSIITIRFKETDKSTVSILLVPGDDKEKDIKGYAIEPSGPSTTIRGQNKRIPMGTYKLLPHRGAIQKDAFKIFNQNVPIGRGILGHTGINYTFTEGCLVFADTWMENSEIFDAKKKKYLKDDHNNPITDNVIGGAWEGEKGPSKIKYDAIKEFCEKKGYKNVKLYVQASNSIIEKEKAEQEKDSKQ